MNFAPEYISFLKENQIFVFGSNLAGKHGLGAAKTAALKFGAEYGIGRGLTGRCYALPTKSAGFLSLSLEKIEKEIILLLDCARENPHLEFLLTPFGTGLAGFSHKEIASLFDGKDIPSNIFFPLIWKKFLR